MYLILLVLNQGCYRMPEADLLKDTVALIFRLFLEIRARTDLKFLDPVKGEGVGSLESVLELPRDSKKGYIKAFCHLLKKW